MKDCAWDEMLHRLTKTRQVMLAVLTLGAVLSGTAFAQTGTVTGLVANATTGAALANAKVSVPSTGLIGVAPVYTDSTGHYTLKSVMPGTQKVTASLSSYKDNFVSVTVKSNTTVTAPNLLLTPTTPPAPSYGKVTGTVVNTATKAPLSGVTITASGTTTSTVTATNGTYTLDQLAAGQYTVNAALVGYQTASQSVTVAAGGTATANFSLTSSTPPAPTPNTIAWNGSNTYLLGANYAWYNYGTDFGTGAWGKYTDWNTISTDFANMRNQGIRLVRWWVFADGRYAPDFNSNGTVSGLDSYVLADIGRAMKLASDNNIYLLLVVQDGSMWSNASYSGSVQMGGHSAIVTNATAQQTFLDNALKPLLQYVTASPYKNRVLGYDIANEPEANMQGYWGGVNIPPAQVQSFVKNCATYIHTYGGGAYATVGCAAPYYISAWKNLGLDFYQIHYYPWMDFNNGAGSGLPTYASLNLDRPCIVGEYPSAAASYGLSDTAPLSARWYLDSVYNKGYAGGLPWCFRGGDSASNWPSFRPVFTYWSDQHLNIVGPK